MKNILLGQTVSFHIHTYHLAQGTLKAESAGVVAGLANKASQLKQGTGADDQPVVVVEFDTG